MLRRLRAAGPLVVALLLGTARILPCQALAPPQPAGRLTLAPAATRRLAPLAQALARPETHSHTLTGLLIGASVGAAATGLFLAAFCSDPDTRCGTNEFARAVLIIALPPAAVGALIGSLIRTKG
jgi:hypothetical protein